MSSRGLSTARRDFRGGAFGADSFLQSGVIVRVRLAFVDVLPAAFAVLI
jgi:hypothetical protein